MTQEVAPKNWPFKTYKGVPVVTEAKECYMTEPPLFDSARSVKEEASKVVNSAEDALF